MLVIADGEVNVDWDHEDTLARVTLGPGCALGVSSLARGESSDVCVTAATDTEVVHLPHDAVAHLLQRHTRLAVELANVQEQRSVSLDRVHRAAFLAAKEADQAAKRGDPATATEQTSEAG